jgi:predicted CxxxxCH...CXXCH cytochrome family protein
MTANITCGSCHTGASASNGGTKHFDGFVNISANNKGKLSIAKHSTASTVSCATSYCHGGGDPKNSDSTLQVPLPAGVPAKVVPTWGANGSLTGCTTCHGDPPANVDHASGTGYVVATSCNGCHDHVTTNGTGFNDLATTKKHINGVIDGGKCDACHGYPPVQTLGAFGHLNNYTSAKLENYSGGGGVHSVAGHLSLSINQSNGFGTVGSAAPGCVTCHPGPGVTHNQGGGVFKTANVQVVIDPQFRFDKSRPIVYNGNRTGTGTNRTAGTCANVSCHFQKSPIWSTETYTKNPNK